MVAVSEVRAELGCVAACNAIEVARASYYRWESARVRKTPGSRDETGTCETSAPLAAGPPRGVSCPRALSLEERERVLAALHEPRFVDLAVPQVWARLIDEGTYLCSRRTMYRVLDSEGEVRERRDQLRRPSYARPELLATGPNQVWSWDITKLRGPVKCCYFQLYVILDIFSRYVVGWMVAESESAVLAHRLIRESALKQRIEPGMLTIHADRGSSMRSKDVAQLLVDLGITKSHSRPHVSDDNPYSEAQFKTIKYRPEFPDRFGSPQDARFLCRRLLDWYNHDHRHSALGWMTPADVHFGRAALVRAQRAIVLEQAYRSHPERFVRRPPAPPTLPEAVWINRPLRSTVAVVQ
jgi:putative transposase